MFTHEHEMATWWRTGAVTTRAFQTHDGRQLRILYLGRPGGSSGPDFRDAVIWLGNQRYTGDIELHLRLAGWHEHGHDSDPQYNRVVLHVINQGPVPHARHTISAAGHIVPMVILTDQSPTTTSAAAVPISSWPCQQRPITPATLTMWLQQAGADRFQIRCQRFIRELQAFPQPESGVDSVLTAAILEALGYGHDPVGLRALASRVMHDAVLPADMAPFDALSVARVRHAVNLWQGWNRVSPAAFWCGIILGRQRWDALLAVFTDEEPTESTQRPRRTVGKARGAIVLWNAVLPCITAYGMLCGNSALVRIATQVATTAPSLPTNAVTRHLTRWLQLPVHPTGAMTQQGLHHLYQQWCQAKQCGDCPVSMLHPLSCAPL